jgi:hypothetical protein
MFLNYFNILILKIKNIFLKNHNYTFKYYDILGLDIKLSSQSVIDIVAIIEITTYLV